MWLHDILLSIGAVFVGILMIPAVLFIAVVIFVGGTE